MHVPLPVTVQQVLKTRSCLILMFNGRLTGEERALVRYVKSYKYRYGIWYERYNLYENAPSDEQEKCVNGLLD